MSSIEKWLSIGKGGPNDPLDPQFETLSGEPLHTAIAGGINVVARRNPYVFVATGLVHAGYHLYSKYSSGSSSPSYQQNGGPGNKSSYKPSEHTSTPGARSVSSAHGGRRSGTKPRPYSSRHRCQYHRVKNPRTGGWTWRFRASGPQCVKYRNHDGRHAVTWQSKFGKG